MKDKKLKELEEKYFNGQSSLEEERALKSSDDAFFQSLNQEKNRTMDWSFEDFQSEINDDKKRIIWWNNSWIKYAAAAMLLMAIGIALFLNRESTMQVPVLAEKETKALKPVDKKPIEHQNEEAGVSNVNNGTPLVESGRALQLAKSFKRPKVKKETKDWTVKSEVVTESLGSTTGESYQADYVVLNGMPVANEQEAVELTLKSLGLLANNLENGVDKAMNIKQMSITIN